jgi:hypothetical protein
MARPILVAARFFPVGFALLLITVPGHASGVQRQLMECSTAPSTQISAANQKEIHEFQSRIESGAFYKELLRRFRKPKGCEIGVDGAGIRLSYTFGENAHLEARANPGIEFSERNMQVPGISEKNAVSLLKLTERESFPGTGCGIKWDQPSENSSNGQRDSHDVVYRGDVCNCQAHVIHMEHQLVTLVFRSAC